MDTDSVSPPRLLVLHPAHMSRSLIGINFEADCPICGVAQIQMRLHGAEQTVWS